MDRCSRKLSYRHIPRKNEFMYSTVGERLRIFAENTPTKEACVVYDNNGNRFSITCHELYHKSCHFAKGLVKLGIKRGDIIAASLPNGPEWMVCTFGIQLAGAIPLLFKFYRHDGVDICNALQKCGKCTAVIFDPGNEDINLKICRCFIQELQKGGQVKSAQVPSLRFAVLARNPQETDQYLNIEKVLQYADMESENELPVLDPDEIAAILLSSGSTGTQKAIQVTHLSLLEIGNRLSGVAFGMTENDIYFNANSFTWGGAYPFTFLYKGTTRVSFADVLSFKSVDDLNTLITKVIYKESCTVAMMSVPSVQEIIRNESRKPDWASSFKTVAIAGSPIPSSCSKILDKVANSFITLYGITELGAVAFHHVKIGDPHEDYSVGNPFPGMEMKIVDDSGYVLPPNEFGEVYVRDCIHNLGYHNEENLTKNVFLPNGWYKTDDVGCMRENGTFVVTGRKSDMIIVGEELVSPSYLEQVILNKSGVSDVVVVAIADGNMFQQACACIIPKHGQDISEETMKEFFRTEFAYIPNLRGFVPKFYLFFDEFPKTPLGKNSRKAIQKIASDRLPQINSI